MWIIYSRRCGGFVHQKFTEESERKEEKEKIFDTKSKSFLIYVIPFMQSSKIYLLNPMAMAVEARSPYLERTPCFS
jgi:hypothetical protein